MATYQFKCTQCGKKFTVEQTFRQHDRHEAVKCPQCRSAKVKQQITQVYARTAKKS